MPSVRIKMPGKIKNFEDLALGKTRKTALEIIEAGLEAIDTEKVIRENIHLDGVHLFVKDEVVSLKETNRIFVIGVGKCSLDAGKAIEGILGDLISGGIIIDVRKGELRRIKTLSGTHPYPSRANIEATNKIIEMLRGLKENDLVIFLISGGGSTFLCQPNNFTCEEEAAFLRCLLEVAVDIKEINIVRKHLSSARGGYLAKYAYPAKIVSLIFSDVVGDDLGFIASGPTVKDTTTVAHAVEIMDKYNVRSRSGLPPSSLIETPKENKYFEKVRNILLVNNKVALEAMARKGKEFGFSTKVVTTELVGEAREVGAKIAEEIGNAGNKTALLYGGETTVTLKGKGRGGRNQELVLSALRSIGEKQLIVSVASDGRDNTDFAGAIADAFTKEKIREKKLDIDKYLSDNDSYGFFKKAGDYVLTGETGSNVSDLIVAIKE